MRKDLKDIMKILIFMVVVFILFTYVIGPKLFRIDQKVHHTYKQGAIYDICASDEYDPKDIAQFGKHTVIITHVNSVAVFYKDTANRNVTFTRTIDEFTQEVNACKP